ncbi:IclR family transcriptional regulator [Microbacterium gilvum]|uniref:IclR family transcriptional regulator C-terminal domain-containing protein n=1 Tax=Microbacterium gilvum TaxID=1336204 RepID=A0ABP9A3C2_9MICO
MAADATGLEMLEKASAVVRALDRAGELTAAQIADETGEPVSSTYRLLANLTLIGWVDNAPRRGRFRLGVGLVRIAGMIEDRLDVREASMPGLRALRASLGLTSYLCVRRGDVAVCIERLDGRDVRSLAMRVGDFLPLTTGAAPRALLAYLPEGERELVLQSIPDPHARRAAAADVAETRARGYSISDNDVTTGIASIGAPVFNHRGELEGAVSAGGVRALVLDREAAVASAVVGAAEAASRALGHEKGDA